MTTSEITPEEWALTYGSPKWRLRNLYWIEDKSGQPVKFAPNDAQQGLLEAVHYRNIILKSRQLGFSTLIQILFLDTALFRPGTACGTIADTFENAKKLMRKVRFAYERLPEHVKHFHKLVKDSVDEIIFENGSRIAAGVSLRSGTYQRLHVSEHGKICRHDPLRAQEVRTGALNTVPVDGMVFIESTAEGSEGDFADMCHKARQTLAEGRTLTKMDYRFHFFPWMGDSTCVLHENYEIPHHVQQYLDQLQKALDIYLQPEQMRWYAAKAAEQGDKMGQEYPSTPDEAFAAAQDGSYFASVMGRINDAGGISVVPYDPAFAVHTGWDLGYGDDTSIVFFQIAGQQIRVIDFFADAGKDVDYYCGELHRKPYSYGKHFWPHDGKKEGGRNIRIAREHGVKPTLIERTSDLQDDINFVRSRLPLCVFDAKNTEYLIKCLRHYHREWNERLGRFTDMPKHDWSSHAVDALRCATHGADRIMRDRYCGTPAAAPISSTVSANSYAAVMRQAQMRGMADWSGNIIIPPSPGSYGHGGNATTGY